MWRWSGRDDAACLLGLRRPFLSSYLLPCHTPTWVSHMCVCVSSYAGRFAGSVVCYAVLCAGFAFEAYNEPSPNDARWERGADGCDVAFMSEAFARQCYAGRLEVDVSLAWQSLLSFALASVFAWQRGGL